MMSAVAGCGSSSKGGAPLANSSAGASGSSGSGGSAAVVAGSGGVTETGGSDEPGCKPAARVDANENPSAVLLTGKIDMLSAFDSIQSVYVVGDQVLYVDGTGIHRIAKTGGAPELVLADTTYPRTVAGPDKLYWISSGNLYSVPVTATGATATLVASAIGADVPNDNLLSVDATRAYFWVRATTSVKSIVLSAGTITDVVVEPGNINWAIHAGYFYFGDDNDSIHRVKLDGTGLELVSQPFDIIWSLAVDDAHVVVGSYQSIFQPGSTPNSLNTTLLRTSEYVERVEIEGDHLVYSTSTGTLGTVALDGTKCTAIGAIDQPNDWAYDDKNFYLAQQGALFSIPK
jgi:hypothetical protein